jgi:hypothetical protein
MRRKFSMKWDLCRQPTNLQKRQEAAFEKGATMSTSESMEYYLSPASRTPQISL